jgi:hypothetical protein
MKKLKLEDLDVASFDVLPKAQGPRGTVEANSGGTLDCTAPTFQPGLSCNVSCPNYTCEGATCAYVIC